MPAITRAKPVGTKKKASRKNNGRSTRATTAAPRRMGKTGSESWHAMLDAAEHILREEGYGALTSRRVAQQLGVKQKLVYYYFQTMDDLIVATFRRSSVRALERLEAARNTARPLREMWNICMHPSDARQVSEFMALANRVGELRTEVVAYIEKSRRILTDALADAMKRDQVDIPGLPAMAVAVLATGSSLTLTREAALGVSTGHAELQRSIERFLASLERKDAARVPS